MEIRLAFPNEVDAIMQVIEGAEEIFGRSWQHSVAKRLPDADIIIEDIISGQAYVALDEGDLLAYAAVTKSPEKSL